MRIFLIIFPVLEMENHAFTDMPEPEYRELLRLSRKYTSLLRERAGGHAELKNLFRMSLTLISVWGISLMLLAKAMAPLLASIFVGYDAVLFALTRRALPLLLGIDGIWLAAAAADALTLVITIIFFVKNRFRYHYA